jgi:hypothetical protein
VVESLKVAEENPFRVWKSYGITLSIIALVLFAYIFAAPFHWKFVIGILVVFFGGLGYCLIYVSYYHGESGYQRYKRMWLAAVKEGKEGYSYREQLEIDHSLHARRLREESKLHNS